MLKEDLIEFVGQNGQVIIYKLTTHGTLIKMAGGWIKHLRDKRIKRIKNEFIKWTTLLFAFMGAVPAMNDGTGASSKPDDTSFEKSKEILQCPDLLDKIPKTDSIKFQRIDSVKPNASTRL